MFFLLLSLSFYTGFQIMRSRCHDECEADVTISNLKFVQSAQDNAKPMSSRMRSRCQDNAKPMSKRIWEFYRVKVIWVQRVVRVHAKPMSNITRSRCQDNAKPMSRRMRTRCENKSEADAKKNSSAKPMSKRVPDNAKPMSSFLNNAWPMSRITRSRCQYYSAKPMSQ